MDFTFTQGTIPCAPPDGFLDYFGPAPHYRFLAYDGISGAEDVLEKIRDMPDATSAEEALRCIVPEGENVVTESMQQALDALYETMEREGPFDGILGYSEGATVAATLILDEKRRFEQVSFPRPRPLPQIF
jgi:predicted esterase